MLLVRRKPGSGADDVASLPIKLNEKIETTMLTDRRHLWALMLALLSIPAGLALFGQAADWAARDVFVKLPALLMIIYGLIVAWWHTQRALSVCEVRTARAVHRALRGPLSRIR